MRRPKLPRPLGYAPEPPPPELRWDAPLPSAALLLGRREFLKALAVMLAAASAPLTAGRRAWAASRGRFFTGTERATLTALCDRILPPDRDPGAAMLGAPGYIERLLTAFDHGRVPFIYAGRPLSRPTPF